MPPKTALSAFIAFRLLADSDFLPPAGQRYAQVAVSGSILPGGRVIQPLGSPILTGPGPFALAASPRGTMATADIGPDRFGITLINRLQNGSWQTRHIWARTPNGRVPEAADVDWKGVSSGLAFESERALWVSEGDSGRVRLVDINSGARMKAADLNRGEWKNSFTGDLILDTAHRFLFVVDETNNRLAVVDARKGQLVASIRTGRVPFALALSPAGDFAYVANAADSTLAVIDIRDPLKPVIKDVIATGNSPAGVLAIGDRVFVANAGADSISVISATTHKVVSQVLLRVPGLDSLRGIVPCGLAFDAVTGWLLVAEAGINAVGVIDTQKDALIAHIPAGWYPTKVAIAGDRVFVANARGRGTGPHIRRPLLDLGEEPSLHHGTVTTFIMPSASELPKLTGLVYAAGGLAPSPAPPAFIPPQIQHVVLIVKRGRAFDEVLGDMPRQPGVSLAATPQLARFGMRGLAEGKNARFSVHDAAITPNHHAIAQRWAFSDNFYADSESDEEGLRWLAGLYPGPAMESLQLVTGGGQRKAHADLPIAPALRDELRAHGISFVDFKEAEERESDQDRADHFIAEMEQRYGPGKEPLPRFVSVVLPNDGIPSREFTDKYPYDTSFVEDNDLALGRILEYLSNTPWWRQMTVFVTEASASEGLDHVDSHRTLLLAAGPWVRRNYISHTNASFPSLLKTILQLLHLPPLNMMDATASTLTGIFTDQPDFTPYKAEIPDKRIFDASR
ncbi:MAG: bifunctional YncE family protein/alkaline phosphatase family protein [Terriglobia bacterium]